MPPQQPLAAQPDGPASWDDVVRALAEKEGVPVPLALAVAKKESSKGHTDPATGQVIIGDAGKAVGQFQLHAPAAIDAGGTPEDRYDPVKNITLGLNYLKRLNAIYKGDVTKVLQAYNGGEKWVNEGKVSPEAQAYAAEVIANLSQNVRETAGGTALPPTPPVAANQPLSTGGRASGPGPGAPPPLGGITTFAEPSINPLRPFNPMTPEGRSNLTAAATDVGAAIATRGMPVGGLVRSAATALIPSLAVGATTAAERKIEEDIFKTVPPGGAISTGATQAAYNVAGQAIGSVLFKWPFKLITGPSVARATAGKLAGEYATVKEEVRLADEMLKMAMTDARIATARTGRAQTAQARQAAAAATARTEAANDAAVARIQQQYDNLLAHVPNEIAGGQAVKATISGPTQRAWDLAGARVGEAAKAAAAQGLTISRSALMDAVGEVATQQRPPMLFGGAAEKLASVIGPGGRPPSMTGEQFQQLVAAAMNASGDEAKAAALPGILGQLQQLPTDQIPFDVAHQIKRLMDASINWEARAKAGAPSILKSARVKLRQLLAEQGHEGYEAATSAYQAVSKAYTKGIGKQIRALADNPSGLSKLATSLSRADTAQAMTMKWMLVDQAAAGGDALAGQRAWDAVRAQYSFQELVSGGVDGLTKRITKLTTERPEFANVVYGDASGKQFLANLFTLGKALDRVKVAATASTQAAKEAGSAGVAATREAGRVAKEDLRAAAPRAAQQAAQRGDARVTAVEDRIKEFQKTRLSKLGSEGRVESEMIDAARAAAFGPTSTLGIYGILRLVFRTPRSSEMLMHVANSPELTQRLTNIMLRPGPPEALAEFLRYMDSLIGGSPAMADAYRRATPQPARAQGAGPRGTPR